MAIPSGFELATDAQFREVSNFTTPPRAGRVTAIEGSGQVRVESDDPDGGDILAWPLNGFTYAVDDVVYVVFAVNSPDSAIVIGSLAPLPTLDAGVLPEAYVPLDGSDALTANWDIGEDRRILAEALRARDSEGLLLEDDAGNVGIFIPDGATRIGLGTATLKAIAAGMVAVQIGSAGYLLAQNGTANINTVANAYYDGAWKRMISGLPAMMELHTGAFQFLTGVTGAADSTISWVSVMQGLANGNIGFGLSPQGRLHAHDGTGGMLFVTKTTINATAQTIIPDGTGDVVRGMFFLAVVMPSSGSVFMTSNAIANNSNTDIFSSGADVLNLRVNSNGSVDVRRTGGSLTYSLALFMVWL